MVKIILLVLLSEAITVIGQILFKKSINSSGVYDLRNRNDRLSFLSEIFTRPYLWLGLLVMAAGLVVWLFAIAQGELSLVYPIGSLQYILVLFSAHRFLGEKIDRMKLVGTLLVMVGIVFMSMS
ncbi:MAG: EamA family transporter [Candidatus Omnitrophica bacterium]|nr:EamA family transporter [Candidatus Omnitrophota bacterium]